MPAEEHEAGGDDDAVRLEGAADVDAHARRPPGGVHARVRRRVDVVQRRLGAHVAQTHHQVLQPPLICEQQRVRLIWTRITHCLWPGVVGLAG